MAPSLTAWPLRLAVQDVALSRRKHGFESRRGHQVITTTWLCIVPARNRTSVISCPGQCSCPLSSDYRMEGSRKIDSGGDESPPWEPSLNGYLGASILGFGTGPRDRGLFSTPTVPPVFRRFMLSLMGAVQPVGIHNLSSQATTPIVATLAAHSPTNHSRRLPREYASRLNGNLPARLSRGTPSKKRRCRRE